MSSILLPKSVRELLDARRRAFLWTGEEKCHGSQCLVAWEHLCQSKKKGGLGIRNLELQNHCLLLKIVHKLLDPSTLPWKTWFFNQYRGSPVTFSDDSYIAGIVREEIQRYRSLTVVSLGDGTRTSFWHDRWLLISPLAEAFPALFSHSTKQEILVSAALSAPSPTSSAPGSQIVPRWSCTPYRNVFKQPPSLMPRTLASGPRHLTAPSVPGMHICHSRTTSRMTQTLFGYGTPSFPRKSSSLGGSSTGGA
jgi:hypothetical protein